MDIKVSQEHFELGIRVKVTIADDPYEVGFVNGLPIMYVRPRKQTDDKTLVSKLIDTFGVDAALDILLANKERTP